MSNHWSFDKRRKMEERLPFKRSHVSQVPPWRHTRRRIVHEGSSKLETLKAQYDEEINHLRDDLAQERKRKDNGRAGVNQSAGDHSSGRIGGDQSSGDHSSGRVGVDQSGDHSSGRAGGDQSGGDHSSNGAGGDHLGGQGEGYHSGRVGHSSDQGMHHAKYNKDKIETETKDDVSQLKIDSQDQSETETISLKTEALERDKLMEELETLKSEHQQEIYELKSHFQNELATALETQRHTLEEHHKVQIEELQKELVSQTEKEKSVLESHREEIKSLEKEWMKSDSEWLTKIEELKSELKAKNRQPDLSLKEATQADTEKELYSKLEREISSKLEQKHSKEMAQLQHDFEEQLSEKDANFDTEIAKLKEQYAQELDALKSQESTNQSKTQEELDDLKQYYEEKLSSHDKKYEEEIRKLKEQLVVDQVKIPSEISIAVQDLLDLNERSNVNEQEHENISARSLYSENLDLDGENDFEYEESESESASKSEAIRGKVPEEALITFDDVSDVNDARKLHPASLAGAADEIEMQNSSKNHASAYKNTPKGDITIDSSQGGFEYIMSDSDSEDDEENKVEVADEVKPQGKRSDSPFPGADGDEVVKVDDEESIATNNDLEDQMQELLNASVESNARSPLRSTGQSLDFGDTKISHSQNNLEDLFNKEVKVNEPLLGPLGESTRPNHSKYPIGPFVTVSSPDDVDYAQKRAKDKKEMEALQEKLQIFEEELVNVRNEHEEDLETLRQQLEEAYTDEMENMKHQHELEIQEFTKMLAKDKEDEGKLHDAMDLQTKLKADLQDLQELFNSMKSDYEKQITEFSQKHESELLHIREACGREAAEVKDKSMAEQRQQLEKDHKQALIKQRERLEKENKQALIEQQEQLVNDHKQALDKQRVQLEKENKQALVEQQEQLEKDRKEALMEQKAWLENEQKKALLELEQNLKEDQTEEINQIRQDLMQKYSLEEKDYWTKELYGLRSELDVKNEELNKVRGDLSAAIEKMRNMEKEMLERHRTETENLIEELEQRQRDAVAEVRDMVTREFASRIEEMDGRIAEREEQIRALEERMEAVIQEKEESLQELQEQLQEVKETGDDLLQRRIEEELFRQQQELESGHMQQLELIKDEYEDLLHSKQKQLESLHMTKEQESDRLQQRIEQELERQSQELEISHATEMDSLRDKYESVLKEKMIELEKLYTVLSDTQDYTQKEIQEEISIKIQEIETHHNYELEKLKSEYEAELKVMASELENVKCNKKSKSVEVTQNTADQPEILPSADALTELKLQMQAQKISYQVLVSVLEREVNERSSEQSFSQDDGSSEDLQTRLKGVRDAMLRDFEIIKGQLTEQHQAAMAAAEAEHQQQLDKMRQVHAVEMEEARQEWLNNGHRTPPESPDSTTRHDTSKDSPASKDTLSASHKDTGAKDSRDGASVESETVPQLQNLQQEKEALEQQLNELQLEIGTLKWQRSELQQENETVIQQRNDLEQENQTLIHQQGNLEQEVKSLQQERSKLKQDKEALEQQRKKLQQERESIEQKLHELQQHLEQEKHQHDKLMEKYQEDMEELRNQHIYDIDNMRVTIKEELLVENMRKLEQMTTELENAHEAELQELRTHVAAEYQDKVLSLEDSLYQQSEESKKLQAEIEEKHKHEIEHLRKQLEDAAENKSARSIEELEEKHTEQLSAAALDTDTTAAELEEAHTQEIQQYKERLASLQHKHQDEKKELEERISHLQQQLASGSNISKHVMEEWETTRQHLQGDLSQRTEQVQHLTEQLSTVTDKLTLAKQNIKELEGQLAAAKQEHTQAVKVMNERDREHQEESNLMKALKHDLNIATTDRENLVQMNERLRNIISETLMSSMSVEERINRQLANLVSEGHRSPGSRSRQGQGSDSGADAGNTEEEHTQDASTLSMFSDEGLDLSQRISESLFVGPDIESDNDFVYDASSRLQAGVDHILDMLTTVTRQLHEAQATQRTLVDTVNSRNEEITDLQSKVEDMETRFKQESETREFLAVEINKAEGLLEGYANEKRQLEEALKSLEEEKQGLVSELDRARAHLKDFLDTEADLSAREDHIHRQKQALEQSIGHEEQDIVLSPTGTPRNRASYTGLLKENAKLSEEKRDLEKQFERETIVLHKRLSEMEMVGHDLRAQYEQQLLSKKLETEDYQRQIQNLEKKVKSNQQFLEEQTAEREQEREEYQQEIRKLQNVVKEKEKHQSSEHRLQRELSADMSVEMDHLNELTDFQKTQINQFRKKVQDLEDHLKDRIDSHNELLLKMEQLEREVQGLKVALKEREGLIKQLEEELESKTQSENDISEKLAKLEADLAKQQEANIELTAELREGGNLEEMQHVIKDLESQLEHARNSQQLSQERCHQLEEELKNLKTLEEELKADKEVLQKQVYDQLNRISTLKLQVEDLKFNVDHSDNATVKELRQLLAQEREALESKDMEIRDLADQLEHFREQVVDKNDEIQQMAAQLQITNKEREHHLEELQEKCQQLQHDNDQLKKQISSLQTETDSSPISAFAQTLIDDKNQEIDDLNQQIRLLQEELEETKSGEAGQHVVEQLKQEIAEKNLDIETKTQEIEDLTEKTDTLKSASDDLSQLQEELAEKDELVTSLEEQITTLQQEVQDLNHCQTKLQDDFDEVQQMLEDKQQEIESLNQRLEQVRVPSEGISAEVKADYEGKVEQLKQEVKTKDSMIEEKEEEIFSLHEKLQKRAKDVENLENQVQQLSGRLSQLQQQLEHPSPQQDDGLLQQLEQQSTLIEELQDRLTQSQTNFKNRQEEFNRALNELEAQRSITQTKTVVTSTERTNTSLDDVETVREQLQQQHQQELERLRDEYEQEIDRLRQLYESEASDADSTLHLSSIRPAIEANEATDARFMDHISKQRQAGVGGEQPPPPREQGQLSDRLWEVLYNLRQEGEKVYSLSQELLIQSRQQIPTGAWVGLQDHEWQEERRSLLAAIQSLKQLLTATQTSSDPSKLADLVTEFMTNPTIWAMSMISLNSPDDVDWRGDLLQAISNVFNAETQRLRSEVKTHASTANEAELPAIDRLEKLVKEQDERQKIALRQVYDADRQSLLAEVQELRARLNNVQHFSFEEQSRIRDDLALVEDQFNRKEMHLKRQLELMEYKIQQERVMREDLASSLEMEKSRSMELASQLTREKTLASDLQGDLADTQIQLTKLQDALEREQARLISSSNALDEERKRFAALNESLSQHQAVNQQVQEDLDFERMTSRRYKDRTQQVIERLRRECEMEKERRLEVQASVERDRMTLASLRRELDLERDTSRTLDHKAKAKIAELKAALDMEKARADEINSALQRERQLNTELREALDEERGSIHDTSAREKAAIADLQAMLDLERSKLLDLHTNLEREKTKVQNLNSMLAAEQSNAAEELDNERAACRQLKNSLETLQVQKQDLARQAQFEAEKVGVLQANAERLQASLMATKDRLREMETAVESVKSTERENQRVREKEKQDDRQKMFEKELEVQRLQQRVSDMEVQLAETRRSEIQAAEDRNLTRIRSLMSPRPSSRQEYDGRSSPSGVTSSPSQSQRVSQRQLESVRQRLHMIVMRSQGEVCKAMDRLHDDPDCITSSISDLTRLHGKLQDLQSELDRLQADMATDTEVSGATVAGLNEKVLRHSSELSSLLTTLTEENHQLYRKCASLYDKVQDLNRQLSDNQYENNDERLDTAKIQWSQERASLILQLNNAEKEIVRLKSQIRHVEIELEREREKYLAQPSTEVADRDKMQRLYGKYLRAESFRKALIYQKKYLIILLGGYQDTEEETLRVLAQMGAHPNQADVQTPILPPLSRFRSAARVIVACTRMKYLVRKWKRATRVGSPAVVGNTNAASGASATYLPTANSYSPPRNETRSDKRHSYLHNTPPTKDPMVYTMHRDTYSQKTETFNQQRDTFNHRDGARRYLDLTSYDTLHDNEVFHDSGAVSPLLYPDMDDALIERLEHVQVRLGQVSQSSKDYMHTFR